MATMTHRSPPRKQTPAPIPAQEDLTTCNICKRYILAARDALQCEWCREHVACIPELPTAKDDEITRIRSSKTSLFYACIECTRVNKESDSSKFFDFNTQLASSEKKNRAEILRLKRELEASQEARQKDNAALHDLQNEQQRLITEREQIVRTEVRESKKKMQSKMDTTMLDSSDTDGTDGNYSAINKLTLNLHQTVDIIKKELATQFQLAITTMTEKFVEMIDRNNMLLRNELLNAPSTSAAARQQQPLVTHDLLLDNFPQMPTQHTQFNFPPPLQPMIQPLRAR